MAMNCHVSTTVAILLLPALAAGLRSQRKATSTLGSGYRGSVDPLGDRCNEDHASDLYRPIKQVAHEHPGTDLNCYFHHHVDYLGPPGQFATQFEYGVKQFTNENGQKGPERKIYLDNGEVLTTHDDSVLGHYGNFALDDAMCYQMGWMKGQRLDDKYKKMAFDSEWMKVAQEECERLPLLVNRSLTDESSERMTVGYMMVDNDRICTAATCLWEDHSASCTRATLEDWVVHLYPKCLLGQDDELTGAAGQIAWCFARGCVDENGVIEHGKDCWPEGVPNLHWWTKISAAAASHY